MGGGVAQTGGDAEVGGGVVPLGECHFGDGAVVVGFGAGWVDTDGFGIIRDGAFVVAFLLEDDGAVEIEGTGIQPEGFGSSDVCLEVGAEFKQGLPCGSGRYRGNGMP